MSAAAARSDVELQMTQAMVDCAYGLGMGFGAAAKAESDTDRSLKLFDAFNRSFQAMRLGIRLSLTLRAEPKAAPQRDEAERDEAPERLKDRPERDRGDTERERDYEPVSLAKFLSTLRGVAADAARLPVQADPAILPKLQGLLAQVDGPPKPAPGGVATKVRPSPSPQRSSLLASTTRPLTLDGLARPRPPPHASG